MSRSRAATPAGKRRTASRAKPRGGHAARKAPKRAARSTPKRPARKAPKRAARRPSRRAPRRASARRRAPVSWRYRLVILGLLAAGLFAGYLFWLRDSSLVAVTDVEVAGVTTGDRERIVAELTRVGEGMTTLHVEADRVAEAAKAFPTIASVSTDANFPHGLRIEVNERPPRLIASAGGREVPVAADGTLLAGVPVGEGELPVLELDDIPAGKTLGGAALDQALILGAVPRPLRPLIEKIGHSEDFGVEVVLRGDIPVRFGSGSRAAEKWAAAAAVLADPNLGLLTDLDVRVPERPAVGGAA